MFHKVDLTRLEMGAYLLLVAGVLGDHISTNYALSRINVYETNPIALTLITNGLWATSNLFLIIVSIAITFISLRVLQHPSAKYLMFFPALAGVIRLAVTIWNVHLLL